MLKVLESFSNLVDVEKIKKKAGSPSGEPLYITSLPGSSRTLLINELFKNNNQIVVLFPDVKSVSEFNVELDTLELTNHSIAIDDYSHESLQEKLTDISKREKFILSAVYDILKYNLPAKNKIEQSTTLINSETGINYNELIEYLNFLNYTKDKFVETPGYYSLRGSIVDFWSYSEKNPVRLEFDGDFLESIRLFDPESQRSTKIIEQITLAASLNNDGVSSSANSSSIFDYLNEPLVLASLFELNKLSDEKIIFTGDEPTVDVQLDEDKIAESTSEDEDIPDIIPEEEKDEEFEPKAVSGAYELHPNANWIIEDELGTNERLDLGFIEAPIINSNYEVLNTILNQYAENNYKIIITAENEVQSYRLKDLLSEFKKELAELFESGKIKIEALTIKKGFINRNDKLLVLTDYQIFNKPFRTKIAATKVKKSKAKTFASIKKGDYVVHENYGIAKYLGLENINFGETTQESMKLQYAEGGIVYVNLNYLHLVKKYSSNDSLTPTLSTLGSNEWVNTKHKTKKKIKEAAKELIELYAKRKAAKGYQFSPDTIWQKELEASFFYEDTPDQEKVTSEVKEDMEAVHPMDRLVCGDVGFGKTEIAVRSAFKAVQDGKQAAVLVPTTILAEQHYNTFKDRLSQFPVRIAVLSRFQTKKEQTEIIKNLSEGQVDVVVGTHRLISKDVKFKDLGLLIIDEEHRFGVSAKEKLRAMKVNVDTLTLTATPIPRTLNLSLLGARDLSLIATPPPNRQPVYTQVAIFNMTKIRQWVLNEINRNGQVYVVHDRVHSIDKLAGYLRRYIPEVKIGIAHGQMKPSKLEEVIHDFMNKKYDILLATKIIESGIDIPNVNTIIINRADRFGLAELHQLRGRVGRSNRQAYAYLIVPTMEGINKKALRRLQAIEEFTEIGSGFNLSMRDLEIRGAGNLLGHEQSGFINDVGFDLYMKMINETVEELKYSEFKNVFKDLPKPKDLTDTVIDTFFDIGITDTYMPDQMDRLNFYTALYSSSTLKEIEEIKDEMIDRFGDLPIITQRLIALANLKLFAGHALFERIIIQRKNIFIILPKGAKEDYYQYRFIELMRFIMDSYKDKVKFDQTKDTMKLVITNNFTTSESLLQFLIKFCREVSELFKNEVVAS